MHRYRDNTNFLHIQYYTTSNALNTIHLNLVYLVKSTCLFYLLLQEELIQNLKTSLGTFYPDDPSTSESYGRIVNGRHFQ